MATARVISPNPIGGSVVLGAQGTAALFILTGTERLRVLAITDDGTATYTINGRMQVADGSVVPFSFTGQSTTSAVLQTQDYNLGAGTLLTLTIQIASQTGIQMWGRNWIQAQVIEGTGAAAAVLGTLVQSYVTGSLPVAWPGTFFRAPVEGPGLTRSIALFGSIAGTTPFTYSPGHPFRIKLVGITFLYTADAVAGNRIIQAAFKGLGTGLAWASEGPALVAGAARNVYLVPGGAAANPGPPTNTLVIPLPIDVFLCATDQLIIQTVGADIGDTLVSGTAVFQQWFDL